MTGPWDPDSADDDGGEDDPMEEDRGDGDRGDGAPDADWPRRDLARESASTTPAATAIADVEADRKWTFADLDRVVGRVAADLTAVVPPGGGRIGLLCSTRVATAVVLHAAMRTGTPAVPLEPSLPPAAVRDRLERADVEVIVCEEETEATAVEAVGLPTADAADTPILSVDATSREAVTSLGHHLSDPETEAGTAGPEAAVAGEASGVGPDPARLHRTDEALVAFTSGTTGEPDGVCLTVGNLVASATASAFRLGTLPGDRWLAPLPMAHLGGLSPVYRTALYGTTLVVQRGFDARETARIVADHDVTGVSLVPTQLRRLLDAGWEPPATLRCVLLGGAPAGEDLLADALARDVPVCTTYGSTETASQIATGRPDQVRERPETVGNPLPFTEVTVVADGDPVPAGDRGELVVDGPTVTPGYLDENATAAAFGEYGLHTGDLGYRAADGSLVVLGRLDDTILTGGETVHPATVADVLREHDAVREAAVVGLADEEWGERVGALVVADEIVRAEGLRHFARDRLPRYAVPKVVGFADELPRTASGTVDRAAVRETLVGH